MKAPQAFRPHRRQQASLRAEETTARTGSWENDEGASEVDDRFLVLICLQLRAGLAVLGNEGVLGLGHLPALPDLRPDSSDRRLSGTTAKQKAEQTGARMRRWWVRGHWFLAPLDGVLLSTQYSTLLGGSYIILRGADVATWIRTLTCARSLSTTDWLWMLHSYLVISGESSFECHSLRVK